MVFGLLKKEIIHSVDDWKFIVLLVLSMLLIPLIVMSVMGSTFQEVVSNLDVIVIDSNSSQYSEAVIKSINDSEYFSIVEFSGSLDEAKDRVGRDIVAVFHLPENFGERLSNAEKGNVSLYLDSSDFIIFNFVEAKSEEILENSIEGIIRIIVEDLEVEKTSKDNVSAEVKNLINSLDIRLDAAKNNLDDLEIDSAISDIDEMKESVDALESSCNCSVSDIDTQISSIKSDLENYEGYASEAKISVSAGDSLNLQIKDKVDNLKLDLKTLKNEFLSQPIETNKEYVFGDTNYFTYLLPAIITSSLFFVIFILTVLNRAEEKKTKKKIKNIVRLDILLIKSLFYVLAGTLEFVYILILAKFVFGASVSLASFPAFVVLVLLAISSIGLGLVFSFIFRTEKQIILLCPIIILPIILISEMFSSLAILPGIFAKLAYASPLYYANLALREIMLKGSDLYDLLFPVGALVTYSIISITIGLIIFLFRKK